MDRAVKASLVLWAPAGLFSYRTKQIPFPLSFLPSFLPPSFLSSLFPSFPPSFLSHLYLLSPPYPHIHTCTYACVGKRLRAEALSPLDRSPRIVRDKTACVPQTSHKSRTCGGWKVTLSEGGLVTKKQPCCKSEVLLSLSRAHGAYSGVFHCKHSNIYIFYSRIKKNSLSLYINRKERKLQTGSMKHVPARNRVNTCPEPHLMPPPCEVGTGELHVPQM